MDKVMGDDTELRTVGWGLSPGEAEGCITGCGHAKYTDIIRLVAKMMDGADRPAHWSYSTLALAKNDHVGEIRHIKFLGPALLWCWSRLGGFAVAAGACKKGDKEAFAVLAYNWGTSLRSCTESRNNLRKHGFLPRQVVAPSDSEIPSEETDEEEDNSFPGFSPPAPPSVRTKQTQHG